MKKIFVLSLVCFLAVANADAQSMGTSYRTALGVKVWDGAGVSFKHFVNNRDAFEFIGYFWNRGTRITGLYEIHGNINGAPGLRWYIGPGAHVGFYNTGNNRNHPNNTQTVAGVDGVLGLDYKINRAPINLSIDWQPSFEFGENRGFIGNWGGLGIRYTF
ncbi:hypothetical protein [Aridibaculum aurantiacum]|uniref:hypothetical protein n=1 Tax=Aridibaculum aurantiacum TaxID=2810307 RepID=UPI001A95CC97|nr:hypothetical protein [Aridibaculum aurantiacum]